MSFPVFCYGTLMCPDVMQKVAGKSLRQASASLSGYRRHAIKNEVFPGMVQDPNSEVFGEVHWLTAAQLKLLDAYEGLLYQRQTVSVLLENEQRILADTYVIRQKYQHLLLAEDWSSDAFIRESLTAYLEGL